MHILLINGSPKGNRSNTLRLADAFVEGISQGRDDTILRRLDISRMDIRPCRGCFACWKHTPGKCCIADDMSAVLDALLWADITVWSFPLYYFGLPGKLKTVFDRQLPLTLPFMVSGAEGGGHATRYDMHGKKTVLISTCGFYTAKSNYDGVTAQFDRICGKGNYTTLFCGEGELFGVAELSGRTDEYLELVRQAGREYASGGIRPDTVHKLSQPLYPRDVFERMADASWGVSPTGEPEDASLVFTRQMAALYHPEAFPGREILLDMDYTDICKRYRIILGKEGSRVEETFTGAPTTVIHTPFSVWKSIAVGEVEGSAALMQHLYSVEGDFEILLKWDAYFGTSSSTVSRPEQSYHDQKSDMRRMLTPWVVFWVAANIHPFWGSLLTLLICCSLPLVFFRNRETIYDGISGVGVGIFSILLLLNLPQNLVMPASYLAFGLMWGVSAFRKIPLSAEYSMHDYGGESAMGNPIFIRTNRILTAAWGVLYILLPIFTYVLLPVTLRPYGQILNYLCPAIMGVFTLWFQKWYPKKIARGGQ